jgi:hypothetical protein
MSKAKQTIKVIKRHKLLREENGLKTQLKSSIQERRDLHTTIASWIEATRRAKRNMAVQVRLGG